MMLFHFLVLFPVFKNDLSCEKSLIISSYCNDKIEDILRVRCFLLFFFYFIE